MSGRREWRERYGIALDLHVVAAADADKRKAFEALHYFRRLVRRAEPCCRSRTGDPGVLRTSGSRVRRRDWVLLVVVVVVVQRDRAVVLGGQSDRGMFLQITTKEKHMSISKRFRERGPPVQGSNSIFLAQKRALGEIQFTYSCVWRRPIVIVAILGPLRGPTSPE